MMVTMMMMTTTTMMMNNDGDDEEDDDYDEDDEDADVFVTSECIHLFILSIVTRCLFRDVSIMYLSHVVMPRCFDQEDQ